MIRDTTKVFGIGFHKTGTTSLGLALERMGFRVCHGARPLRSLFGDRRLLRMLETRQLDLVRRVAEEFDAFRDTPWFMLHQELDRWFPGSKFILTVRDENAWLKSAVEYFGTSESDFRHWIYGAASPVGHEDVYRAQFRRHGAAVRTYFSTRPDDLLIVDWERGDGWAELGRFLGRPTPDVPFPWARPARRG